MLRIVLSVAERAAPHPRSVGGGGCTNSSKPGPAPALGRRRRVHSFSGRHQQCHQVLLVPGSGGTTNAGVASCREPFTTSITAAWYRVTPWVVFARAPPEIGGCPERVVNVRWKKGSTCCYCWTRAMQCTLVVDEIAEGCKQTTAYQKWHLCAGWGRVRHCQERGGGRTPRK